MIWVPGQVVADHSLSVSVLDRTFEHGLGLFETFRTWNGHPTLLDRHQDRMENAARELGLPLKKHQLPEARDVSELIEANRERLPAGADVRLRLTMTGGTVTPTESPAVVWMSAAKLPPPLSRPGAVISRCMIVDQNDTLARHKTLNYWRKRIAHAEAVRDGDDEALVITADDMICEATRSNVFVVEGRRLRTPSGSGPLLAGIMRQVVLNQAERLGLEVDKSPLPLNLPRAVSEAFLTNSVWGMIPIARFMGRGTTGARAGHEPTVERDPWRGWNPEEALDDDRCRRDRLARAGSRRCGWPSPGTMWGCSGATRSRCCKKS